MSVKPNFRHRSAVSDDRAEIPASVKHSQPTRFRERSAVNKARNDNSVSLMFGQYFSDSFRSAVSDGRATKPMSVSARSAFTTEVQPPSSSRVCSAVNKDSADNPVLVTCMQEPRFSF